MNKKLTPLLILGIIFSFSGNIFAENELEKKYRLNNCSVYDCEDIDDPFIGMRMDEMESIENVKKAKIFPAGKCPSNLKMTQNLRAPREGDSFVRNGRYHWYTKTIVREADILQKHLNRLGFNAGKVDGIIGPNTKGAILRMQAYLGTKQDGYVGPKTRALLNNSCGTKNNSPVLSVNYSGDLKILHSEKAIADFIKKNRDIENEHRINTSFISSFTNGRQFEVAEVFASLDNLSKSTRSFSETNTQVSGVDESDVVKSDGKYIYTLSDSKKVFIVDASDPKNMDKVSEIAASDNENIQSMYLHDGKLILLGSVWENTGKPTYYNSSKINPEQKIAYYKRKNFTRVSIYNISNPKKPTKEKTFDFEGNSRESRITNGHLYLLTNKYFYSNNPIMPLVREDSKNISSRFGSDVYYIDSPQSSRNILSLSAINLKNTSDVSSTKILMPNAGNIYVSADNFYITYNKYIDRYATYFEIENKVFEEILKDFMDAEDLKIIEKIKNTDSDILTDWEKDNKIKHIWKKYDEKLSSLEIKKAEKQISKLVTAEYIKLKKEFEKTKIEKFSLNGTSVKPTASGEVSGFALNQFSMSQIDGNFFIATTNNRSWLPWQIRNIVDESEEFESENNLYSLDENLKNLDSVEGLAKGERIKSVRFIGDHAYMVTFRQTDPLFNIDISNPKNMKLLGELKIDGFSSYLHPVFTDRLIGIGRDVKVKDGRIINGGIKVTLFDISKNTAKEIQSLIFGKSGSYSEALHNHKAVLVSEDKNIISFPVTVYAESGYKSRENNILVIDISKNSISLKGKIPFGTDWNSQPKRVLYINNSLYSTARDNISSYDLDSLSKIDSVVFKGINKEIIFDLPLGIELPVSDI